MRMKFNVLALLFALSGVGFQAVASQNEGIDQAEIDEIVASCKEESQGAENPEAYSKECADERIQALKEERGLAVPKEQS